jgi:tetratricopeptide (TPR) repeat protein
MLDQKGRTKVWAAIALLFVLSAVLVAHLQPQHEQYLEAQQPKTYPEKNAQGKGAISKTPFQALIPIAMGFREVIAALMWVQADDLFHRGEYAPIMSLIKQISLIDPHNLDVYATGAWHMAYNFMDRRLVSDGVDFLRDGVENNPHVYDLFFELGYMHYDKTKDYDEARKYYGEARTKPTTTGKNRAPGYVYSAYAHALERLGYVDEAIEAWRNGYELARDDPGAERDHFVSDAARETAFHNWYMTRRRRNEREATWLEWQGKQQEPLALWQANVDLAHEYLKTEPGREDVRDKDLPTAMANVERLKSGILKRGAPKDMAFDFTWKRVAPRRIEVEGKMDLVGYARVVVILRDRNYDQLANRQDLSGNDRVAYKMANATLFQDNTVQVRDGKFHVTLRLNEDPADMGRPAETIFPLKSEEYELTVIFDPRQQSNEVQDRFGWNGEALADSHYLVVDPAHSGRVFGQPRPRRLLQKTVFIRKEDILGPPGAAAPAAK